MTVNDLWIHVAISARTGVNDIVPRFTGVENSKTITEKGNMIFTFTMLKYFCINHGDQRVLFNLSSQLFLFQLNDYVVVLQPLYIFNYFTAGTDFRRHMGKALRTFLSPT